MLNVDLSVVIVFGLFRWRVFCFKEYSLVDYWDSSIYLVFPDVPSKKRLSGSDGLASRCLGRKSLG